MHPPRGEAYYKRGDRYHCRSRCEKAARRADAGKPTLAEQVASLTSRLANVCRERDGYAASVDKIDAELRAMTEERDAERLGRLAVERKVEDLETDTQRLADELAAARAERDEAKHQLDRVFTVLMMKPGDVIPGVGKVYRKRVDNGHFTWEIDGGVISQNNVVAAFERADRIASIPPAEPGSGTRESGDCPCGDTGRPGHPLGWCDGGRKRWSTPPVNTVKEG
jgi:hypothetical protein